jgi:anti-sigma B factor antagonist
MAELEENPVARLEIGSGVGLDGAIVITVSGELDMSNAERLSETISATIADHPERLVFDLRNLRFMDSAGIAVLIRTAGEVGDVEIRDPAPAVRRVLELTGLTAVMRITP